jgi:aspartate--ammonia ligase
MAEAIVGAICDTNDALKRHFPTLCCDIKRKPFAITSEDLLALYPNLDAKAREYEITKKHGTVLIIGIGGKLSDGTVHDTRAPDYDDWELNCDIIIYNPVLDCALEISSMGIRVNAESLTRQLRAAGCEDRGALPFHRELLEGRLPLTVGGGIGQSRLCMLMMGSAHIGEVQVSVWDAETRRVCRDAGIPLL